jgi:hypothetical protein
MGSMITKMTDYVGVDARVRTKAATSQIAVRSRAHAGTPAPTTGEFRLLTDTTVVMDDAFAPSPGTGVPGGPSA